jgi:translation initiation factor IF-1
MSKDDVFTGSGKIVEILPNALFRVKIDNGTIILGHLAGKLRVNNVNILLGDTVDVEISPYDVSKCRIVWRHKQVRHQP